MIVTPLATPVTTPFTSTDAIAVLLLLQEPPIVVVDKDVVAPTHTALVPVIGVTVGKAFTVKI